MKFGATNSSSIEPSRGASGSTTSGQALMWPMASGKAGGFGTEVVISLPTIEVITVADAEAGDDRRVVDVVVVVGADHDLDALAGERRDAVDAAAARCRGCAPSGCGSRPRGSRWCRRCARSVNLRVVVLPSAHPHAALGDAVLGAARGVELVAAGAQLHRVGAVGEVDEVALPGPAGEGLGRMSCGGPDGVRANASTSCRRHGIRRGPMPLMVTLAGTCGSGPLTRSRAVSTRVPRPVSGGTVTGGVGRGADRHAADRHRIALGGAHLEIVGADRQHDAAEGAGGVGAELRDRRAGREARQIAGPPVRVAMTLAATSALSLRARRRPRSCRSRSLPRRRARRASRWRRWRRRCGRRRRCGACSAGRRRAGGCRRAGCRAR